MPKKSQKKQNSNKEAVKAFSLLTNNQKNVPWLVSNLRNDISISSYTTFIKLVRENQLIKQKVFNKEFPESIKKIRIAPVLRDINLEKEFRWAGTYLLPFHEKINTFLSYSKKLEDALFSEDYQKCRQILESIQEAFGVSLWLIKTKIALLQISEGLESQKQYVTDIRLNADGITDYIAFYISIRNEATISPSRFSIQFQNSLKQAGLPKGLENYFEFQIDGVISLSYEEIGNILRFALAGPIIDYYETLVEMAQIAIVENHIGVFSQIAITLEPLADVIEDRRLEIILFRLKNTTPKLLSPLNTVIKALTSFFTGDYQNALLISLDFIANGRIEYDLLEIAAYSFACQNINEVPINTSPFLSEILIAMRSVILKSNDFDSQLNKLIKIATNFETLSFAARISRFIQKETSSNLKSFSDSFTEYTFLRNSTFNPIRAIEIENESLRESFANLTSKNSSAEILHAYSKALINNYFDEILEQQLALEEILLLKAEIAFNQLDFSKSIELANSLYSSSIAYYQQLGIRIITLSLLRQARFEDCISFITTVLVRNASLRSILAIEEVIENFELIETNVLRKNISLPIFLDIVSRFYDSKWEDERAFAYEDFLIENTVHRPSELDTLLDNLELDKLIYYLRFVCIEAVMDNSTVFESSREVAEERLKICRMLVELDPKNIDSYHTEIKEILRRLMIQSRMREIEQSKIYIDTEAIKKKVESTMKESYQRYLSFVKNNFNSEIVVEIKEAIKLADTGDIRKLIKIELPPNEMNDIFERMIIDLRDEFVSNTLHGLDGYLSVRIRHGTLEGQLRKPLEEAKLITERDSATGVYKSNDYWLDNLGLFDLHDRDRLDQHLKTFAKSFDEIVQKIKNDWIQIKKTPEDKGLFDFRLHKPQITLFSTYVNEDTKFEEFLDRIFTEFTNILTVSLENVRDAFQNEAKTKLNDLLINLQNEIDELMLPQGSDLINVITATRTEMQYVIDRITEWFRLSKTSAREPVSLEEAISISQESVKTRAHDLDVQYELPEDNDISLEGNRLISFVDILFIIFENIIKHSKMENPRAFIRVEWRENAIHFFIENQVAEGVITNMTKNRIQTIKSTMREDGYYKSVTTEGGTGFHKIWKILAHDFHTETELNFDFIGTNFYVEFSLPARLLDYEDSYS